MTVEVEYKDFDQFYKEYTKDISRGGLFIKTNEVRPPLTVLEIILILPELTEPLKMVGEVVHTIEPELAEAHGWTAGMGVHFIDFDEGARQILDEYVGKRYKHEPAIRPQDRRRHKRKRIKLRVKFPSPEVLRDDYSQDISKGGIFIQTPNPRKVGDRFDLTLVHPETERELGLEGEVVRITQVDPGVPGSVSGMGIRFVDLTEENKKDIEKFLNLG